MVIQALEPGCAFTYTNIPGLGNTLLLRGGWVQEFYEKMPDPLQTNVMQDYNPLRIKVIRSIVDYCAKSNTAICQ